MAIIDEKGRLFGKVNLLDLVVVLVVVAGLGLVGNKFLGKPKSAAVVEKPLEVTFLLPAVRKATVDQIQPGVKVYESKSANRPLLGTVVAVRNEPARVVITGPEGKVGEVVSQDKVDLYMTLRGTGTSGELSVFMGGIEMKVGRGYDMISKYWAGTGTATLINENPAESKGQ